MTEAQQAIQASVAKILRDSELKNRKVFEAWAKDLMDRMGKEKANLWLEVGEAMADPKLKRTTEESAAFWQLAVDGLDDLKDDAS